MAVSALLQVLVALRFYATGAYFRLIGDSFGLSAPTVHRCVHRVSYALLSLAKTYIKFPTGQAAIKTKQEFYRRSGFPQVVGALDGTFVRLKAPSANENDYMNRKGFYSLNIQMTCVHNFAITSCVAKWPGSVHDSRIFRDSHLCRKFDNGTYNGILLGDSAYLCKKYLMTPYIHIDNESQRKYNTAHCLARVSIEQTFGILKRRFPCLHFGLRLSPQMCCVVVTSCVVLHNIGIIRGDIVSQPVEDNDGDEFIDLPTQETQSGACYRNYIRQTYFQ